MSSVSSDSKSAKIEDVAKAANVSIMSVSRAMRGVEGISAAKRDEILKIAENIGYSPNRAAVSLAVSTSNLIGISVPTLFGSVFSEIFDAMRNTFEKSGFQTVIGITDYSHEKEWKWLQRMISWRPAGIILTGANHDEAVRNSLRTAKIPTLEIWDYTQDPIDLCIGVDHREAGYKMGQYLVKSGYTAPAYIGVEADFDIRAENRFRGLRQAFVEAGYDFICQERISTETTYRHGMHATERMLARASKRPDVICFLNDNMAYGGLLACEKKGLSCPRDIGVVGYNGLNINEVIPKRITTTVTPRTLMGIRGAGMLIAKSKGADTEKSVSMPVRIDKGSTTKRASNG